jgi:serine protease AprX
MAKNQSHQRPPRTASLKVVAAAPSLPQGNISYRTFDPHNLATSVIALPLLQMLERDRGDREKVFPIIIDLHLDSPDGLPAAKNRVIEATKKIIKDVGINKHPKHQGIDEVKSQWTPQYLFARLEGQVIRELVRRDGKPKAGLQDRKKGEGTISKAIYHIWPDFQIRPLTYKSISTVKVDAVHFSFSAFGQDIVWAVVDTGIDAKHPHFKRYQNLELKPPLNHLDLTGSEQPTEDKFGHGTHVAGIIAGNLIPRDIGQGSGGTIRACEFSRDENGGTNYTSRTLNSISGMAPRCKLLSLKVCDDKGIGGSSNVIAALGKIQEINGYGRHILVHGVNISLGYPFDVDWFACGQSPLCAAVDRLVRSGVVVVVAAGNSGFGGIQDDQHQETHAALAMTISDPGNAELAITVGSTHRDMPHVYGISHFSSKGPTGDGRLKPDLVAPGERIVSCATGTLFAPMKERVGDIDYCEHSGTSEAAPHVSGAIAAFLSVRREFIGQPERVKQILLSTATDLKRDRYFQGYGMIDLMRAIQSV